MSKMGKIEVTVEVEVNPTEDLDKVRVAVNKTLGEMKLEVIEEGDMKRLIGKAEGLEALSWFHNLLRRERILDAARTVFFRGLQGKRITFYLNKQVAYVGHVSFSQPVAESPLGPIHVEIRCDNPQELIDWLAPKTG